MSDDRASRWLHLYDTLDAAYVKRGSPPTSPWWRAQIERFLRSARRQFVLRVGRRGGKSSTLSRVAICEALMGDHAIPPGDIGIVGFVSVSKDEASSRLRTIKAHLDIVSSIGIKYEQRGDAIEIVGRRVVFKVFAATTSGVVGGTWICAICDEVARWRDNDSGANPATEVLTSLRPTLATQRNAKLFLSSSPWSVEDAHAKAFEEGDNDFQLVAHAPTWVANPTIAEEETRLLERDERAWRREYAAIPQAGLATAFDADMIDRAIRPLDGLELLDAPVMLLDSSAGGGDAWTWGAASWCLSPDPHPDSCFVYAEPSDTRFIHGPIVFSTRHDRPMRQVCDEHGNPYANPNHTPPKPTLAIYNLRAIEGAFRQNVTADDAVDAVTSDARALGATQILSDQYQSYFLTGAFSQRRLHHVPLTWTNESKSRAVVALRRLFADGAIAIEPGAEADKLRGELLAFQEKISPSGVMTYGARRGAHDDRIALLLNLCMGETEGLLRASPHRRVNEKRVLEGASAISNVGRASD